MNSCWAWCYVKKGSAVIWWLLPRTRGLYDAGDQVFQDRILHRFPRDLAPWPALGRCSVSFCVVNDWRPLPVLDPSWFRYFPYFCLSLHVHYFLRANCSLNSLDLAWGKGCFLSGDLIVPSRNRCRVSCSRMESGYNACSFTPSSSLLGAVSCSPLPSQLHRWVPIKDLKSSLEKWSSFIPFPWSHITRYVCTSSRHGALSVSSEGLTRTNLAERRVLLPASQWWTGCHGGMGWEFGTALIFSALNSVH